MLFTLQLWVNILKYTDALTTVRVAKTCKPLYALIQIYLEKKLISPIPALQTTLEITEVHASWKNHILSVDLPTECSICVFKDVNKDSCFVYKVSDPDPFIAPTFPNLRSPNQKVGLHFKVFKTPDIEFKCLTSKLNMELHHDGSWQWWSGTSNVMLTPRTKKIYHQELGDGYFYFPFGRRRGAKGYKVKIHREIFNLYPLQPLSTK